MKTLKRHDFNDKYANVALVRIKKWVDIDEQGRIRLRNTGLQKVDELISGGFAKEAYEKALSKLVAALGAYPRYRDFSPVLVLDSHLLLCYTALVVNTPLSLRLLACHPLLASARKSRNSFPCHTYENRARKSFPCHTSKKRDCKSFACHTFFKFNCAVPNWNGRRPYFSTSSHHSFLSRPLCLCDSVANPLFLLFLLPSPHRSTLPQNVLQGRN